MTTAISWSGGKDGWLALLRARAAGQDVRYALTMFDDSGERCALARGAARSDGAASACARADAGRRVRLLGGYEDALIVALPGLAARGVERVVFGDIDIAAHRTFEERVCGAAGLEAMLPLWQQDRRALTPSRCSAAA